jgi:tRNA (mo5U34)-methyltransferase
VTTTSRGEQLRDAIAGLDWYHTIELPDGTTTPGWVDCRPIRDKVLIPADLTGKRVLDVGTWDGFWAFDLERRGAEVVTVDLDDPDRWDWPPHMRDGADSAQRREVVESTQLGVGFALLHEALGSTVTPVKLNVYDLSPETVGTFDLVVVGSILLHLRDPVGALAAVRSVARGPVVLNEAIELVPTLLSPREPRARLEGTGEVRWWQPNLATIEHMARSAGLAVQQRTRPFFIPLGSAHPLPAKRHQLRSLLSTQGREHVITWNLGIPHVSLLSVRDGD